MLESLMRYILLCLKLHDTLDEFDTVKPILVPMR